MAKEKNVDREAFGVRKSPFAFISKYYNIKSLFLVHCKVNIDRLWRAKDPGLNRS